MVAPALALGAGCLLVVVGAAPASAHASLVRSRPADLASVATPPRTVSLTFDEDIRATSVIRVTNADGASVVQGTPTVVDNILTTRVRISASGDYTVAYRVVSVDGHPVPGRLSFTVGAASPGGGAGSEGSSGPSTTVIGGIAVLALLGGVGLLTARRWAPNKRGSS